MKNLVLVDLFCGAGGTSTGAVEAAHAAGYRVDLTAINHWDIAIATHHANHPSARTLCTNIDDVNPRTLYREGQIGVLWASPECTHHSVARGGRPINEQSRATAWCVVRWADAVRPQIILIENVPEFLTWGGVGANGRPLLAKKGKTFHAWKSALESLGYRVAWKILCAADYGDPTTRRRLFIQAVRGRRRIIWPNPTHAQRPDSKDMLARLLPWVPAREIIDWSLEGKSIYDRKKSLSDKTMRRIMIGLEKFGLGPFIVPQQNGNSPRDVEIPAPTVTTTSRGIRLIEPFLVQPGHGDKEGRKQHRTNSVDTPLGTVPCSNRFGLAEPFLVELRGTGESQLASTARSVDQPIPTVTAGGGHVGVVEPFIIGAGGPQGSAKPRGVREPLKTVLAESRQALVQPFVVGIDHTGGNGDYVRSVDSPLSTVSTKSRHAVAEPFLVQVNHGNGKAIDGDTRRTRSTKEPLPTVCGERGEWALAAAQFGGRPDYLSNGEWDAFLRFKSEKAGFVLPQQSGGAVRSVAEPIPTVATDGAIGLIEPYLIKFYGTAKAQSVQRPLDTVTTKDRHGLVRPVVMLNGEKYLLDIRFRMLQPHELALAQGFRAGYEFTGNKTAQVKQIGNAVPRRLARAIVAAALTQDPDVTWLWEALEGAGA